MVLCDWAKMWSCYFEVIVKEKNEIEVFGDGKELGRFRFNVFVQKEKIFIAIRHIPLKIPTFEELKLPVEPLKKLLINGIFFSMLFNKKHSKITP